MQDKHIYFKGLNLLRFGAAFSVMAFHLPKNADFPVEALRFFNKNLALGVDFFFLISGFLIIYLLLKEKEWEQNISFKDFYIRRALRILPLYYLIILIDYFFLSYTHKPDFQYFYDLIFLGNIHQAQTGIWAGGCITVLWSICIEEHFYLVIPLLVFLLSTKNLQRFLFAFILFTVAYRIWITAISPWTPWMPLYVHTFARGDGLAIGGLLACAHHLRPIRINWSWQPLAITLLFIAIVMATVDFGDFDGYFKAATKRYLLLLPFLFLFIQIIFNENPHIERLKEIRIFDYLGKISYGIYMYHSIVIELFIHYAKVDGNSSFFKFLICGVSIMLLTILIATISYEFLEKPILSLKKRFERVNTSKV